MGFLLCHGFAISNALDACNTPTSSSLAPAICSEIGSPFD